MIRTLLAPPLIGGRAAIGLLLLRLVVGLAFILHGLPKIHNPTGWMTAMMGPHAFAPPFFQAMAAIAEFFGGIALILGFLTPLAALLILIDMATAILKVHIPMGGAFVGGPGSFEQPLTYFVAMLLFLFTGPGTISLDARLFRPATWGYR
ncbi:MAG: DoxX family protein [Candidatus Eremiobacteraeota bacterium]|nr:DoxX family protein [Candidatus Eremiobacteraeota bacterium]